MLLKSAWSGNCNHHFFSVVTYIQVKLLKHVEKIGIDLILSIEIIGTYLINEHGGLNDGHDEWLIKSASLESSVLSYSILFNVVCEVIFVI